MPKPANPVHGGSTKAAGATCSFCGVLFPSKTKMFKHLRSGETECTEKAVAAGMAAPQQKVWEKVAVILSSGAPGPAVETALREAMAAVAGKPLAADGPHGGISAATSLADHAAACTVVSMHAPRTRPKSCAAFAEQLNAHLPASARVALAGLLLNEFDAEKRCDKRVFEVMVPLQLLCPPSLLERGWVSHGNFDAAAIRQWPSQVPPTLALPTTASAIDLLPPRRTTGRPAPLTAARSAGWWSLRSSASSAPRASSSGRSAASPTLVSLSRASRRIHHHGE